MYQNGISSGQIFNNVFNSLINDGNKIQEKMNCLSNEAINQMDLLEIQFMIGQYNAKLEVFSQVIKSIQDLLKTLAQRTN